MLRRELPLSHGTATRRGLLGLRPDELRDWLAERGQPSLRNRQIRNWIIARRAVDFAQMTDLPQSLRAELAQEFTPLEARILRHLTSRDGTEKLLLGLADQQVVECVLMREAERRTV